MGSNTMDPRPPIHRHASRLVRAIGVSALAVLLAVLTGCAGPTPGHAQAEPFASEVHQSDYDECFGDGNVNDHFHVYLWFVPKDWPGTAHGGKAADRDISIFVSNDVPGDEPEGHGGKEVWRGKLKPMTEPGSFHQENYRPAQNPGYSTDQVVYTMVRDPRFRLTVLDHTALAGKGYKIISNEVRNNRCAQGGAKPAPDTSGSSGDNPSGTTPANGGSDDCSRFTNKHERQHCEDLKAGKP